jgi:D-alanyl-D-alanine carboxypeptidase
VRDAHGVPTELWVGGSKLLPKDAMLAEATQRYRKSKTRPGRSATSA